MADYDPVAFGCSLRTYRTQLGWSAKSLLGTVCPVRGPGRLPAQPGVHLSHRTRHNTGEPKRRAILASLVGMPLALGGTENSTVQHPLTWLSTPRPSGCIVTTFTGALAPSDMKEGP